ncbi:Glyceraldehyde-3-phosphate dehydrogenase, partial [Galemys pyrenaicus]
MHLSDTTVKVKVRVNIFAQTGCLITSAAFNSSKVDIVAISDSFIDFNTWSTGQVQLHITDEKAKYISNGKFISIFQHQNSTNIKRANAGAEYVMESTGVFTILENAGRQLRAEAKKIIISASSADAPTFMIGIVINTSCTTSSLAPLVKVIHDNFGIKERLMIIVPSKKVDDPSRELFCDGQEAAQNIIPVSASTSKVVPALNVSKAVNLTCHLEKAAKFDDIKKVMKQVSQGPLKGILGYTKDQIVSCYFNSDTYSSTFNAKAGIMLNDHFVEPFPGEHKETARSNVHLAAGYILLWVSTGSATEVNFNGRIWSKSKTVPKLASSCGSQDTRTQDRPEMMEV